MDWRGPLTGRFLLACSLAGLLVVALAMVATSSASAAPPFLGPGDVRFWPGGHFEYASVPSAGMCGKAAGCPEWQLQLAPGGRRLRVASDTASRADEFTIELIDPTGHVRTSAGGSNVFDVEAFADNPAAGVWTVRLIPTHVDDATVRLRAKLEGRPGPPGPKHMLLPNLRAVPPHEFGFAAPANPAQGLYPPDTIRPLPPDATSPPLEVAGIAPLSCAIDEYLPRELGGAGAKVCLRFTAGPINVGAGHFVKTFSLLGDVMGGGLGPLLRGRSQQVVYWSDGTTTKRPSGTYSFHLTHAHFHDDGILTYELFRLDGPRGKELFPAGTGTKSGFCPADQLIGDWRNFDQAPAGSFGEGDAVGGSCFSPADGAFTLTKGWGDVYRWQRPGQYVEFSGNGDGYYVLRTTVDKGNTTLESDENDNSGYALIRITGHRVDVIERGQGQSHLDPCKVVFSGFGPASHDPYGGPDPHAPARRRPSGDCTVPKLSALRLTLPAKGSVSTRVRFRLSEPARVRMTLKRGRRTVAVLARAAAGGRRSLLLPKRLSRRTMAAGRYRLTAVPVDPAGNTGVARSVTRRRAR